MDLGRLWAWGDRGGRVTCVRIRIRVRSRCAGCVGACVIRCPANTSCTLYPVGEFQDLARVHGRFPVGGEVHEPAVGSGAVAPLRVGCAAHVSLLPGDVDEGAAELGKVDVLSVARLEQFREVVRGVVIRARCVVVSGGVTGIGVPVVVPVVVVVASVCSALGLGAVAAVAVAVVAVRVAIVVFFLGRCRVKVLVEASGGVERANGLGLDAFFQDLYEAEEFEESFVVFRSRSRDCAPHPLGDGLVVKAGCVVVADEPSEGVHNGYAQVGVPLAMVAVPLVEVGATHEDNERVECSADTRLGFEWNGRVGFDGRVGRAKHRRAVALQCVDDFPDAPNVVVAVECRALFRAVLLGLVEVFLELGRFFVCFGSPSVFSCQRGKVPETDFGCSFFEWVVDRVSTVVDGFHRRGGGRVELYIFEVACVVIVEDPGCVFSVSVPAS